MTPRAIRKMLLPSCMVATAAFCLFVSRAPSRSANVSPPHADQAVAIPARPAAVVPIPNAPRRANDAVKAPNQANGPGAAGMVVARDPETGELGMPSPEQMRAINQRRAEFLRITPEGFTEIRRPDGAVELEMNGRLQSYSVVRVGADGRPSYQCVSAGSDTAAVLAAPAPALEER